MYGLTVTLPRLALVLGLLCGMAGTRAEGTSAAEAERQGAIEAARKVQVPGPADVPIRGDATLKLPKGYVFIPTPAAADLMRSMGNGAGDTLAGLVFPDDDRSWMVVIRRIDEGHIKDEDAKDWNADELLQSLQEGTEAANEERTRRGMAAMEVIGWAEKPRYDSATHRLVWSASSRDKGASTTEGLGVNYNTYALGRQGYISLNLVTDLASLPQDKPAALELLEAMQFNEGRRYADFDGSTDKVAAYGLAALVAGTAAKKLGLIAIILAFLAKFSKVLVVAGGAAVWGVAKLLGRKRQAREAAVAAAEKPPTT
jgi:uncharacterized membrane-anchored protein